MTDHTDIVERLKLESDLCANEGAGDIVTLLDDAASVITEMKQARQFDAAEITRLRAEAEALRKDAERYRWLRVQDSDDFEFAVVKNPHFDVYGSAAELDAAIDATKGTT